jgi:urease accessory protein
MGGPGTVALGALLLADGRFPAGGHAHSAGMESAVADGRVRDEASLAAYLEGRLRTAGLVDAALAAATALTLAGEGAGEHTEGTTQPAACGDECAHHRRQNDGARLAELDGEAEARLPAPPLRAASRKLGRQLVRVGGRCWPGGAVAQVAGLHPDGPHQAVALGAVGLAAGCDAGEVATLAVHHALATPAQAAIRLLGLDPFGVAAVVADLAPAAATTAAGATTAARNALAGDDLAGLPALSSPLVEVAAVEHRAWDMRLFAT